MLTMYDLLCRKKAGMALTEEEISYFVKGYTEGHPASGGNQR